jgi:hypothetical protein
MNPGSLTIHVQTELHGALEDSRVGLVRRTIALWLISMAQWLLKSRIDIYFLSGKS